MTDTSTPARRLPLGNVLSFATAAMPLNALVLAVAVFMTPYLTSYVGLSLAAVAFVFGFVRFSDIGVDFVLGLLMDRTRTGLGRYRPWLIAGAPVLMVSVYFLFLAPRGSSTPFLFAALLGMYLGMSILSLAHTSWASTLAPSYDERSRLFGAMTGVGIIASVVVLLIPVVLDRMGRAQPGVAVHIIGWMIIILTPLTVALVALTTKERIQPQAPGVQFRLLDYWDLISRPSMLRVLIADFALTLGPGWMSAMYFFFFNYSRGFNQAQASLLLLVYIAAGLIGAPMMGRLANVISKHRATLLACTVYSLMLPLVWLLPRGNMLVMAVPMFILGFMAAGFNVLTRAMTADIADEVRLEQGKERTGLLFAITTLTGKLASAGSITLTLLALAQVGFDPNAAVNTPEAIRGLEYVYLIGPIFFVMVGGLAFIGYKLTAERHAEIRAELEIRDAAAEEAPVIRTLAAN